MSNYAHELFLLSVNLSQFKSKVLVTKVFVESLNNIFNPHTFSWCDGEVDNNGSALEVCTKVKSYGYIEHTVSGSTTDEELQLLQNGVQMLALLLEKLEQEQLLQNQKEHLSQLVDKRTAELANEKDALKEAKNRLQIVSDNMLDLVSLTDLEGNYKYTGASHQILGYDIDFFIGKNVMDFVHPDDLPEIQSQLTDFITHKKPRTEAIYRYRTANGSYLWFETIGTFIFDVSGDPREIIFNTRDITERKRAEENLRESEEKHRRLFETMSTGVIYQDADGKITSANPASERILHITLDQMSGKTSMDPRWKMIREDGSLVPGSEHPIMIALRTGKKVGPEVRGIFVPEKNEYVWILINAIPLFIDGEENPCQAYTTFDDITERKRAESQLRKLSQAVEQSPAIVVITNLEGNIEYVNPKFTEVTGYTPDAAIGQNPRILKSGEQTAEYYKELWQTISSGKEWRGEFHNKKKNGELFWEAASISPIVNSEGKTTHYLAVKEDITNRKKAEQELILAKEKAEENDRLKSAFLQNMSHEIRTPLNSIIGFSERINSPKITDEKRHLYSGIIVKSGLQLLSVVSDILLISTIDTGQEQLNIESICINLLISEVETVFKQQLCGKRVKLKSIVPLPNATAEILTDKTKLNQILTNLLSNAVKYTSVGEIKFGYNQKNNELEFFVKDNGIGIHESKHKVIFERFVQADDSIHIDYGGTGLGLSICKGYVELLGGKIWVESEPGKGATFLFTIPYKPYKTESGDDRYRC